jgi:hypothetical protein
LRSPLQAGFFIFSTRQTHSEVSFRTSLLSQCERFFPAKKMKLFCAKQKNMLKMKIRLEASLQEKQNAAGCAQRRGM